MAFSDTFRQQPLEALTQQSLETTEAMVDRILARGHATSMEELAALLSPAADTRLERMAALSQRISQRHFGKTIRLFAPIYLSNECINICKYCGFSRNNDIPRITVAIDQVEDEVRKLAGRGFRSLLIVAGEHPRYVSNGYVEEVIRRCLRHMPSLAIELGPMETPGYAPLVEAGCEGLIVYQETYHEATYRELHVSGPKKKFEWRMDTPERGYAAGFRRIGIGALFGLWDWRFEALAVGAHARYLLQNCWKATLNISLPRMRPAAGGWQPNPEHFMPDRALVQTIAAYRLFLPTAGLVLSTREPADLRDGLVPLGITTMSAGSSTEPGGYSSFDESQWTRQDDQPGEQFAIADERPPHRIAQMIQRHGYEPVWKDFEAALVSSVDEPSAMASKG